MARSLKKGPFVDESLMKKIKKLNADNKKAEAEKKELKVPSKSYIVKRGEYLKLIADRYALSNQELADLTSGLTAASSLMVGQKINVPLNEVNASSNAPLNTKQEEKKLVSNVKLETKADSTVKTESYTVQRGDTLYSIASQSKMAMSELAELNSISANSGLRIGQSIKIPAGSTVPEQYTVQSGDTLTGIASRYNLGMDYVANVNGINRNTGLRVGQRLKLTGDVVEEKPEVKTETKLTTKNQTRGNAGEVQQTHVVKSGENLTAIAQKYHLQLNYLAELNGLSRTSTVRIGQKLKIAGDLPEVEKEVATAVVKSTAPVSTSRNTESYVVKSGESLNSIANRVGMSVTELAELNDLSARAGLRVGQKIALPKTISEYRIKRGDTLIGLASRYGMESNVLADMNNIQPSAQLRIGDVIKVPN